MDNDHSGRVTTLSSVDAVGRVTSAEGDPHGIYDVGEDSTRQDPSNNEEKSPGEVGHQTKRLVLIDGKSVFYRGYYAMGALSLKDGTPTGGVYGFAAIAMEIAKRLSPTKIVVAWDSRTSVSQRRALYPDYKAGRVKPGEDFYAQIPLLEELIHDLGWSFVELDNYEADDIIGTLSREADEAGDYETFIISSDLDMLQIVDDNTHMWRILKGFTNIEKINVPELEEKYHIKKDQFLDLKALKGDSSDNIPGVPGIGEKTAAKLLNDYGALDGIYAHLSEIKGSTKDKLASGKDSAYLSQKLARIMFDAPIQLSDIPDYHFDHDQVIAGLKKLEFNSLIRKMEKTADKNGGTSGRPTTLSSVGNAGRATSAEGDGASGRVTNLKPVGTVGRVTSAEGRQQEVAQDDDTSGRVTTLKGVPRDIYEAGEEWVGRTRPEEEGHPEEEGRPEAETPSIISWSIKSSMHADQSLASRILSGASFWDLSQAAFLLNPLAREEPRLAVLDDVYHEQLAAFAGAPKLYQVLTELDLPLIPVLYKMEHHGMLIDDNYFTQLAKEYTTEVSQIEQEIYTTIGQEFNLNSPIQLSNLLFNKLALPVKGIKKTTRGYSTGAKELDKLKDLHPVIPLIIAYREASKLLSTYILPMPSLADARNRIHTTFTQNVTATGRLSSKDPNLQNIPVRTEEGKRIRTGFIAPPGKLLISADYSQFELRLAAVLAHDTALIDDFNHDVDIHTKTASEAFHVPLSSVTKSQRRAAKVVNFGILYGMSVRGLAEAADMPFYEAKAFIDNYFTLRAPIKQYLDSILAFAKSQGYVETYFGRRRPTPDVNSPVFTVREAASRAAMNMPIQGTEADLMKCAMLKVDHDLPAGSQLVMQVHDSLIVECDASIADTVADILKTDMETVAPELPIKLAVEVTRGSNWGEL